MQPSILDQIDTLTAELCDLCAHYKQPGHYRIPDTPRRMQQLRAALYGPGGLWEQRRSELALARAGGQAVCLGPTDAGRKRGERGIV